MVRNQTTGQVPTGCTSSKKGMNMSSHQTDSCLLCRWLMFHSTNSYKNPCFGEITVMNRNPYPVAWYLDIVLLKNGDVEVIYLISSDDWPREVVEYTGKRHKIVAECLKIPDYIRPSNNSVCHLARAARLTPGFPPSCGFARLRRALLLPLRNLLCVNNTSDSPFALKALHPQY
ncbi:unnamed protein product [Haemonchus placei]|uniref:PLAT domain-containing protein n=1 Tax=Haemonchus placei TaxID=6290 RepID=A0A0N4WPE2_HAEPC|nr:unnamed protein product [Haemonchus placei]